jgi:hypothetical protein
MSNFACLIYLTGIIQCAVLHCLPATLRSSDLWIFPLSVSQILQLLLWFYHFGNNKTNCNSTVPVPVRTVGPLCDPRDFFDLYDLLDLYRSSGSLRSFRRSVPWSNG